MKRIIFLVITIVFCFNLFAQDIKICEERAQEIFKALNSKSTSTIEPYLDSNFTIGGQTGEIAKLILPQFFKQLNDSVIDLKKKSEDKGDFLNLVYFVKYKKMGDKEATITFTNDNKIREINLFKMSVKVMQGENQMKLGDLPYFTAHFKYAGNLILVQANIDGETKNFLFDSGAPSLILNQKYFLSNTDTVKGVKKLISSDVQGVSQQNVNFDIYNVKNFSFQDISFQNQDVMTSDLTNLEKESKIKNIYGLIGYDIIKNYDILYNYKQKEIVFIKPEYTEQYLNKFYNGKNMKTVPITMFQHIPNIEVYINNVKYIMGVDCGAEELLIESSKLDKLKPCLKKLKKDQLTGFGSTKTKVESATIKEIQIGGLNFKNLKTVFADLSHLKAVANNEINGLLGYSILSKQPTLVRYANKKMVFITQ